MIKPPGPSGTGKEKRTHEAGVISLLPSFLLSQNFNVTRCLFLNAPPFFPIRSVWLAFPLSKGYGSFPAIHIRTTCEFSPNASLIVGRWALCTPKNSVLLSRSSTTLYMLRFLSVSPYFSQAIDRDG